MIKRLFDLLLAMSLLIVLWPLLLILAVLVRATSEGPVFYRGRRVGLEGQPFRIFKFRTMVVNADRIGGPSAADDDPRITLLGVFLRRYKLDEFPQLLNILHGEMSFVGPRPEVESEIATYTGEERLLLTVRPGLTDYASIRFHDEGAILRGSRDPHEAYLRLIRPEKVRLGLEYVRRRSAATDIRILYQTFRVILASRSPS